MTAATARKKTSSSKQVATTQKKPGTAVMIRQEGNTPASATATMVALAQAKDFDAEKFKALATFQSQMVTQQAMIDFVDRQHAMQPQLPEIRADGKIEIPAKTVGGKAQNTPYATLANINRIIKPILQEHGFTLSHRNGEEGGKVVVITTLARGLHSIESKFVGAIENSGSKNNTQGAGSTISYGRRYNTISLLNLTTFAQDDFDDNGRVAGDPLMAPLTADQFTKLNDKLENVGADKIEFCKYFKIEGVAKLPQKQFDTAMSMLDQKASKAASKKAAK